MVNFKKYFFYEIAAYALIFIGVLLNLQVNNWNESRKAVYDTENEDFVRDYLFSDDGAYLTLSPKEEKWKRTSLKWKKVE